MTDKKLGGKTIAIMVNNGFDEIEFTEPQKRLIEEGATVKVVSRANGLVNGWYDNSWGHFFPIDADLADTLAVDYQGLIIPGGIRSVDKMFDEPHAKRVLKACIRAGMPIALFGDAAKMLIATDDAKGRTLAASEEVSEDLATAGAVVETGLVTEGSIVSTSGHETLKDALHAFVDLVAAYEGDEVTQAA